MHVNKNIIPTSVLLELEWTDVIFFGCVKIAESTGLDPNPKKILSKLDAT